MKRRKLNCKNVEQPGSGEMGWAVFQRRSRNREEARQLAGSFFLDENSSLPGLFLNENSSLPDLFLIENGSPALKHFPDRARRRR